MNHGRKIEDITTDLQAARRLARNQQALPDGLTKGDTDK